MTALRALEGVAFPVAAVHVTADGIVLEQGPVDRRGPVASLTKPLTALAVLVAVEEGLLTLDEPLGPPGSTARHLLAHASGLAPDQRRLLTEPGTRRIYSNAAYDLLGEIVATRADMSFGQYLNEAVFEPLGMAGARLTGSPASGVEASCRDLGALVHELLRPDPVLLARATRLQLASPAFPEIPGVLPGFGSHVPNPWGLGFELRGHKDPHWTGSSNSPSTFGHFGRSGGMFWADPSAGVGCASLAGKEFGPWAQDLWPRLSEEVLRTAA